MRTVVTFGSVGKGTVVTLEKAPSDIEGINNGRSVRLGPLVGGDARERGEELLKLLRRHPPVKAALSLALAQPAEGAALPLYIRVAADAADALPWELLYSTAQGFFALDPRWPVARIASRLRELNDRSFLPPFQAVAVLSAAARKGQPQLEALTDAVTRVRETGLDLRLHVITGEKAVMDRVTEVGQDSITAEWIGATPQDLARQITNAKPSVLHLLCHGGFAAPGVRGMAFATIQDMLSGEEPGSITMPVALLARALSPCDPWLVVLAACETAQSSDGSAIAHRLVDAGIPAVIGMRRLVDLSDMNRFSEALYPEIFSTVAAALEPGPEPVRIIDWAAALTAPRQAVIVGADPTQVDIWSDPVLYAQQDPLRVYVPPAQGLTAEQFAAYRARLDTFLEYRQQMDPATTPPGLMAEVDNEIARLRALLPGDPDE